MRVPRSWLVLTTIAVGGVLGSLGRYGLARAVPRGPGGFPWATFVANCSGALLIGMLMVLLSEVWPPNPYLRPFLGVGVLGGFTTFSAYQVETRQLLAEGRPWLALGYLAGTLTIGLFAVVLGAALARTQVRSRRSRHARRQARATATQVSPDRVVPDHESGDTAGKGAAP